MKSSHIGSDLITEPSYIHTPTYANYCRRNHIFSVIVMKFRIQGTGGHVSICYEILIRHRLALIMGIRPIFGCNMHGSW